MKDYLFTAWFRNTSAAPDDQDNEWVACLVIEAKAEDQATAWGNRLAKRFAANSPSEEFLWSRSEPVEQCDADLTNTPRITFGQDASDSEIGW